MICGLILKFNQALVTQSQMLMKSIVSKINSFNKTAIPGSNSSNNSNNNNNKFNQKNLRLESILNNLKNKIIYRLKATW